MRQTEFFVNFDPVLYFHLPPPPAPPHPHLPTHRNNLKIKLLKKWKTPRDIIILHMCTINENHMVYGS